MKVLTVNELYSILADLILSGKGERVILVPNEFDSEIDADYRTIGYVDAESDIQEKYIYLEAHTPEEENAYFEKLEAE